MRKDPRASTVETGSQGLHSGPGAVSGRVEVLPSEKKNCKISCLIKLRVAGHKEHAVRDEAWATCITWWGAMSWTCLF